MGIPSSINSFGLPDCDDMLLDNYAMKYVRFCTEVDKYGKEANSIFVNIHGIDNTITSNVLPCNSYYEAFVIAYTALGEMRLSVRKGLITGIHFGGYYPELAASAKTAKWKPSTAPNVFTAKGTAVITLSNGTQFSTPANTLQMETNSMMYPYLKHDLRKSEDYHSLVYFTSAKKISFSKSDQGSRITATATMYAGDQIIMDLDGHDRISAYYDKAFQRTDVSKIVSIEIDMEKDCAYSVPSDVKITDQNGNTYLTPSYALNFVLTSTDMGIPYQHTTRKIEIEDGFSFDYTKVKKLEFLSGEEKFSVRLQLKDGNELVTKLTIGGYYTSWIQFLTSRGMTHLKLNNNNRVKYIEFL